MPNDPPPASLAGRLYESDVPHERILGVFSKADRALSTDDPSKLPDDFLIRDSYPFKDDGRICETYGWVATVNHLPYGEPAPQTHVARLAAQAQAERTWFHRMLRVGIDARGELIAPTDAAAAPAPLLAAFGCNALVAKMHAAYQEHVRRVWAPRLLLLLRGAWKRKRDGGADVPALKVGDVGRHIEIRGDELCVDGVHRPVRWVGAHHFDVDGKIVEVCEAKKGDIGIERGHRDEKHVVFIGNPIAKVDVALCLAHSGASDEAQSVSLKDLGLPAATRPLVMAAGPAGDALRREIRARATAVAVRELGSAFGTRGDAPAQLSHRDAVSSYLHLKRDPLADDLQARVSSLLDRQQRDPGPFDQFAVWFELRAVVADKTAASAAKCRDSKAHTAHATLALSLPPCARALALGLPPCGAKTHTAHAALPTP